MHFAQAAVLLASDHTATPASEATDGIASPQHRRCASSRRRPSRSGRGGRVGSLPVRVWWIGPGAVHSGPPQLRMRRRKATALPTGCDRGAASASRCGTRVQAARGSVGCALPLFLQMPVGNAAQQCPPPLETTRGSLVRLHGRLVEARHRSAPIRLVAVPPAPICPAAPNPWPNKVARGRRLRNGCRRGSEVERRLRNGRRRGSELVRRFRNGCRGGSEVVRRLRDPTRPTRLSRRFQDVRRMDRSP